MSCRVLLISPPWRLAGWPSLGIGCLKAFLTAHDVKADAWHMHLDFAVNLGWDRYEALSKGWELPEALFFALYEPVEAAALLAACPPLQSNAEEMFSSVEERLALLRDVEGAVDDLLGQIDFASYDLIGLSVGALQLAAAVYLSKKIRELHSSAQIVFGGSGLVGGVGQRLLEQLPWVDAVVDGEGEQALLALSQAVDGPACTQVPNLFFRTHDGVVVRSNGTAVLAPNAFPPPDYSDFFDALRRHGLPTDVAVLPVEMSRGCQWEHRLGDGKLVGCTFCGLYRGSPNFRQQELSVVLERIAAAVKTTRALHIGVVDAYLPAAYAKDLLRGLATSSADVTLFCEMRCDLDEETARLLGEAGARHVQLGVEAFDTRLLGWMGKGTRLIDNLSSMKLCEEYGVPYQYNLLTHLPGADLRSLSRTLELIPRLFGFRPPSIAKFYLDRGSRIYRDPLRFGLDPDGLDHEPLPFFPKGLSHARLSHVAPFSHQEPPDVKMLWSEIEAAVVRWQDLHRQATSEEVWQLFTWRDSGSALIIFDARSGEGLSYEIDGVIRRILLATDRPIHRSVLGRYLADVDPVELDETLQDLVRIGVLVRDSTRLLSLPVRARLPNGATRHAREKSTVVGRIPLSLVAAR